MSSTIRTRQRKTPRGTIRMLALGVAALALITCSNPMLSTLQAVVTEYQKPVGNIDFASGSSLGETTPIVVTFTDSMKPTSLTLGGTLAGFSNGGKWSASEKPNDTVTISPSTAWPVGNDRTLTVSCEDTDEYAMEPISVAYGVLDGSIYVHAVDGSDRYPGTYDRPKASVQAAVETVQRVYDEAQVCIAGGQYFSNREVFVHKELHLTGGYNPTNWSERDPLLYPSIIQIGATGDTTEATALGFYGAAASGSTASGLTVDLEQPQDGQAITVVDSSVTLTDLHITVTAIEFASGISLYTSSATVDDCVIGVTGSAVTTSGRGMTTLQSTCTFTGSTVTGGNLFDFIGLSAEDSSITVDACRVSMGLASDTSYGAYVTNSMARFTNNVMYAGVVTGDTAGGSGGMIIEASDATVWNNTFDGGSASNSLEDARTHGFILVGAGTVLIENNIIMATAGDIRLGVKQLTADAEPDQFNNNLIYLGSDPVGPDEAAYRYVPTEDLLQTAGDIESFLTSASGNLVGVDPQLATDYSFTGPSPGTVTGGGLDLTDEWPGATDILGVARTGNGLTGWSMGAYEQP